MGICEKTMKQKLIFFILLGIVIYFSLVPEYFGGNFSLPKIRYIRSGFLVHILGYFFLGGVVFFTFDQKKIWYYLGALFIIGVILELMQTVIPLRFFTFSDVIGNTIGIFSIGLVIFLQKRRVKTDE